MLMPCVELLSRLKHPLRRSGLGQRIWLPLSSRRNRHSIGSDRCGWTYVFMATFEKAVAVGRSQLENTQIKKQPMISLCHMNTARTCLSVNLSYL